MGRKSRFLMVRKFILEEDKYSIVNYSSNGTYLNGGQLLEREKVYHLPHGTTFRVTKEDEFKVL